MSTRAESQLQTSDWQEETTASLSSGTSVSRATAHSTFSGDLEGGGASAWLLVYPADGLPTFVGTQIFEGSLDEREGAFVLRMEGVFGSEIAVDWSVIAGSGSGQLQGLTGTGGYRARPDAPSATATLDWDLAP